MIFLTPVCYHAFFQHFLIIAYTIALFYDFFKPSDSKTAKKLQKNYLHHHFQK